MHVFKNVDNSSLAVSFQDHSTQYIIGPEPVLSPHAGVVGPISFNYV